MKTIMLSIGMIVMGIVMFTFGGCKSDTSSSYGSSGSPGGAGGGVPPNTVVMANTAFSPSTMTVPRGTTITWKNNDGIVHTTTSNTGVWNSGDVAPGSSKMVTFNTAGTFPYFCAYHQMMGMTGTIIVQ